MPTMEQPLIAKQITKLQDVAANLSPWLILALLLLYTYAKFFVAPYPGFEFSSGNGEIDFLYTSGQPGQGLRLGDRIIQIGPVTWDAYQADLRQALFEGVQPGQVVPIVVERGDQHITVQWVYPHPNREEVLKRLPGVWWLAYFFWFFGTATVFFLRPRDNLWGLMIAANFLTATWLMAGSLSQWAIWHSAIMLRLAIWLSLPVYLHLHWLFPRPLGRLPGWGWKPVYLLAFVLAICEWFQLLPTPTYFLGFFLAFMGSFVLLVVHAALRPAQRRELRLMATFIGLAIAPSIPLAIAGLFGQYQRIEVLGLLGLPAIPMSYLYTAYRRRLGRLELRTNQAITLFIFTILLLTVSIPLALVVAAGFTAPGATIFVGAIASLLAGLASAITYTRFQRWAEQHLLGIPLPPTNLIETYAERITTSLDMPSLIHLLKDEILPSLLVRQSALLQVDGNCQTVLVYAMGIESGALPMDCHDPLILSYAGQYRPVAVDQESQPHSWVRLVLPLTFGGKQIGLWLLGRRDPDDFYAQQEIAILQALANQTAVALINAVQTERLHALYQTDIQHQEAERSRLALELHDDVLGQMAMLRMNVGEASSPQFEQAYQAAAGHIREIINGLRPAMLNYGLRAAIDELVDEAPGLAGNLTPIQLNLPPSQVRYPTIVELHLYRIVQQACQNALSHARAGVVHISGFLNPEQVELIIEDNGRGFEIGESLDLVGLLVKKHFGLAGMYERAALIGAQLQIDSAPDLGTRLKVSWRSV